MEFLRRTDSYAERTTRVDVVETHMSWVFLTDRHAYKLKKPVRYSFLDFSTVEARRNDCAEELRLNRRLAPDVYLDVVPLTQDSQGRLTLAAHGTAVDWLVKMRRLPDDRRLDRVIAEGRLAERDVRAIALRLASFYRGLPAEAIDVAGHRHAFRAEVEAARNALKRPVYRQDTESVERLCEALRFYLIRHADTLDRRVEEGRIVEGHGDLRPEHVYLGDDVIMTDCLEFNRDLRIADPADELSYLAMECERLGAPAVRAWLFDAYGSISGDAAPTSLIDFYTCFRACLRARIALAHLDEPVVAEPARWIERGRQYVDVGLRHAHGLA